MSVKSVNAGVIRHNNVEFRTPKVIPIPVEGSITEGIFWRVPYVDAIGLELRYAYEQKTLKPSSDSVRVLRIKNTITNDFFFVVVADNATVDAFDKVGNGTGTAGTQPAMPGYTMPKIIIEQKICKDDSGNYNYAVVVPTLAAGQTYALSVSVNGNLLTPTPPNEGFASIAAVLSWLQANYASAGTWAATGQKLTLVSTTAASAAINVDIKAAFDSNAAPTLTGGQNFGITVVANGVTYPQIVAGNTLASVVTAVQADLNLSTLGLWASITGNKIRLTAHDHITSATITLAAV